MTEPSEALRYNNGEPGVSPALPTGSDIRRNYAEWKDEVDTRVSCAVNETFRTGRHPSETIMRGLGLDGRKLYHKRMSEAATDGISAASIAGSNTSELSSSKEGQRIVSPRPVAASIVRNEVDWRSKQERRPSYTSRAGAKGFELTLLLTAAAVILLHTLPDQGILSRASRLMEVFR